LRFVGRQKTRTPCWLRFSRPAPLWWRADPRKTMRRSSSTAPRTFQSHTLPCCLPALALQQPAQPLLVPANPRRRPLAFANACNLGHGEGAPERLHELVRQARHALAPHAGARLQMPVRADVEVSNVFLAVFVGDPSKHPCDVGGDEARLFARRQSVVRQTSPLGANAARPCGEASAPTRGVSAGLPIHVGGRIRQRDASDARRTEPLGAFPEMRRRDGLPRSTT